MDASTVIFQSHPSFWKRLAKRPGLNSWNLCYLRALVSPSLFSPSYKLPLHHLDHSHFHLRGKFRLLEFKAVDILFAVSTKCFQILQIGNEYDSFGAILANHVRYQHREFYHSFAGYRNHIKSPFPTLSDPYQSPQLPFSMPGFPTPTEWDFFFSFPFSFG